ncbi:DUF3939 domain-containing protein [Neobacillus kokaensis]|uniref:DUF3939 domain-containing protein n=1 Tax=Neobacillus kokaensis TaxID=2759023 RepID=A0ABQ3N422_9BACI|nr:DUF3939 domain-containing protein [Neobacillus kokaensis]GHH98595.1 hypothetical protein AM1BK_21380 [Neobacillus kokaensis]
MSPLSFSWIFGVIIVGFVVYFIIKFFISPSQKGLKDELASAKNYPTIDVTLDDVRMSIRKFSEKLPKGVYRTILVQDDHSIDFHQLAHILGGIPTRKFYMSKETYDLFEEDERHIPPAMDMVQKAVDRYVEERKEFPLLSYDPLRRVNYYQLLQENYLKAAPEIEFYITELDGLITHNQPEKKGTSQL